MQFSAPGRRSRSVGPADAFGYEHELTEYSSGLSIEKLLLDSIYDRDVAEKLLKTNTPH